MIDANDKLQAIGNIMAKLKTDIQTLATSNRDTWKDKVWDWSGVGYVVDELIGVNDMSDSIDGVIFTANKAYSVLEETKTPALLDDSAYERWLDLAQSLQDNITTAIGATAYNLREFIGGVGTKLKENAKEVKAELALPTIAIVVILVLVLAILVVK